MQTLIIKGLNSNLVQANYLAYNWFKEEIGTSVRPEMNPQYFISKNGKLYISEVQESDAADYHCVASMVARQGEVLASNQSPSRISKPIKVKTLGGCKYCKTFGCSPTVAH
ncbi:contactin [Elysia marginata]|uniref:Contactin n=1 Tax=Elysia marginata TaxID=1093978 RepID=A0AAV4HTY1_9GAST|nr:contactin [Elysia marginata]